MEPGVLSEHVSGEGQSCVRQVEAGGARGLLGFVFSVDSSHGHFVYNRLCLQTNTRFLGDGHGFIVEHLVQPPLESHGDRQQRRLPDDSVADEIAHEVLRLRHAVGVAHQLRPRGLGGVAVGLVYVAHPLLTHNSSTRYGR